MEGTERTNELEEVWYRTRKFREHKTKGTLDYCSVLMQGNSHTTVGISTAFSINQQVAEHSR